MFAEIPSPSHLVWQRMDYLFANAYLKDDRKIRLSETCGKLYVDRVEASTGYAPVGEGQTNY